MKKSLLYGQDLGKDKVDVESEISLLDRDIYINMLKSNLLLKNDRDSIISLIKNIDEDFGPKKNLIMRMVGSNPHILIESFDHIQSCLDEDTIFFVCMFFAEYNPFKLCKHIQHWGLMSVELRLCVAKKAAYFNGRGVAEYINGFDLDLDHKIEVFKFCLLCDPQSFGYIQNFCPIQFTQVPDILNKENIEERISKNRLALSDSGLLNITYAFSDTTRAETGIKLMAGLIDMKEDLNTEFPSRIALRNITGMSIPLIKFNERFNSYLSNIYSIVLQTQKYLNIPLYELLKIEEGHFFDNVQSLQILINILYAINEYVLICGKDIQENMIRAIQQLLSIGVEDITVDNANLVIEYFKSQSLNYLKENIGNKELSLNGDLFKLLKEKWGNIQIFLTLFARFYGNKDWNSGLDTLLNIINMDIKNEFISYKYGLSGLIDENDQKIINSQVGFLDSSEFELWRNNSYKIDIISMQRPNKTSNPLLVNDIDLIFPGFSLIIGEDFLDIDISSDKNFIQDLKCRFGDREQMIFSCFSGLFNRHKDDAIKIINRMKSNKDKLFLTKTEMDMLTKIKHTILGNYGPDSKNKQQEAILITMLTDEAKLMLSLGTLMDQYSCHNADIGTHVHSLLGYTIDSNTKLLLSFLIFPNEENNMTTLTQIQKDILNDNIISCSFDIKSNRFTMTNVLGKQYLVGVEKPQYKQILRIGRSTIGGVGLAVETRTINAGDWAPSIINSVNKFIHSYAGSLNASIGEDVYISPSRSILGTYSDLGGGVKKDAFIIKSILGN